MSDGDVGILNVGLGDTKVSFDKSKPAERDRAAAVVTDMLQRGYAILVQVGEKDGKPIYMRGDSFDPETCEYIIVGLPERYQDEEKAEQEPADAPQPSRRGRKPGRKDASKTTAVAVARSAGG